eukprot:GHVN01022018.1.p2 GENE.GHVN01022018.1~~GHVN01022018.1.p2  ORF type:complete len:178 (-),score=28.41 GHVN01022018.1:2287-2820(-)
MSDLGTIPSIDLLKELRKRYEHLSREGAKVNSISTHDTATTAATGSNLIFLGAPGCGKGTQAEMVKSQFGLCHLSTGDLLREMTKNKTSHLGIKVSEVMEKGELVDDALISELVVDKIASEQCKNGYVLDGFPRTITQAESVNESRARQVVLVCTLPLCRTTHYHLIWVSRIVESIH